MHTNNPPPLGSHSLFIIDSFILDHLCSLATYIRTPDGGTEGASPKNHDWRLLFLYLAYFCFSSGVVVGCHSKKKVHSRRLLAYDRVGGGGGIG